MRHVIVGTAGHIDHGKSALVKALTGIDPDRLKEEKLRGITIDLGFAHLNLDDIQVGFVDVPGHERFVKNMLAGVGGIDLVLLVVAADESVMPQTREHFDICRLLGIRAGIVTITKTDLVEPDMVELVRDETTDLVKGSFLDGAPVVAVSARTGAGIDILRREIQRVARSLPDRPVDRLLRLPIDRAFSMRGFGTVVTGTLLSGEIRRDEETELIPAGRRARVRGIQVHGQLTDRAVAGQRTAVNLQGVDLGEVSRGMVLTVPQRFQPSRLLDVSVSLLPTAQPLRNLVKVRFHHGTSEVLARVALLGHESLAPGGSAFAQLRTDSPVFCLHGDRFIVRQFSPAVTVGGGTILNPHPPKHKITDRAALHDLETLAHGDLADKVPVLVKATGRGGTDLRELNACLGLPDSSLRRVCAGIAERGRIIVIEGANPSLVLPELLRSLEDQTLALVREFHAENPLQRGIPREELRKRVFDKVAHEVFRYTLDTLSRARKISVQEDTIAAHGREVQLSERELALKSRIEGLYVAAGYQPPLLSEIVVSLPDAPEEIRKIYFWMLKEKQLVRLTDDLAYLPATLDDIKSGIRRRFTAGSRFGVAEFKELFDLTRKHAIPLLEFLDRERFTRRHGNERILL